MNTRYCAQTTRRRTLAMSDLARAKAQYRTKNDDTPGKHVTIGRLLDEKKALRARVAELQHELAKLRTAPRAARMKAEPRPFPDWPLIEVEDIGREPDERWRVGA